MLASLIAGNLRSSSTTNGQTVVLNRYLSIIYSRQTVPKSDFVQEYREILSLHRALKKHKVQHQGTDL